MIQREHTRLSAVVVAGAIDEQPEEKYLTPAEFSGRYPNGPSLGTLANWRSQALRTDVNLGPPFTRIGGRIYYALSGVLAWERRRTIE
jgi:hypothetical protein